MNGKKKIRPEELGGDANAFATDAEGNVLLKEDGTPQKKRGRKPGQKTGEGASAKESGSSRTRKASSKGVEMLAAQFQIFNTGLAFLTNFEDFKLDDAEAMQMAEATANVIEQFDYTPDPKITAMIGLVTTTGMIYGPRVYMYRKMLAQKNKEKRASKTTRQDEASAISLVPQMPSNFDGDFGNLAG